MSWKARRGSVHASDHSCVYYLSLALLPVMKSEVVPEVVGAVLVADKYESSLCVILCREDTHGSSRVMFIGVCAKGLVQLLDQVGILAVERVALGVRGLLFDGVKVEGGVVGAVVVTVVAQAVVRADQDTATAARQLDCAELCLVVFGDGGGDV